MEQGTVLTNHASDDYENESTTVRLLGRLLIRCYQRLCLLVPDGYIAKTRKQGRGGIKIYCNKELFLRG